MSEQPKLRVSREAVKAARAEVAAFEAAGIADKLDPLVRRIAEAKPVVTPEPSNGRIAGRRSKSVISFAGRGTTHHSTITGRITRNRTVESESRTPRVDS